MEKLTDSEIDKLFEEILERLERALSGPTVPGDDANKRVDFVLLLIRVILERLEKIEQCQAIMMEEVTEMKERISFILLENI